MKRLISFSALISLVLATTAFAKMPVKILDSKFATRDIPRQKILNALETHYKGSDYREIRTQVIYNKKMQPDHLVVYLHSNKYHRIDIDAVTLDINYNFKEFKANYQMQDQDFSQQPGIEVSEAACPDATVEFIAICPNDNDFEQDITNQVLALAKAKGLKTVKLDDHNGTRTNWLNYMSCPNLKGNFYDGDSNPSVIVTSDGTLSAREISSVLKGKFAFNVTNVWVACEAYNDPMLSSVTVDAQAKKYAAGVNSLLVGPSDKAALCAMKEFLNGKPMTESFQACYDEFDSKEDIWGFGGKGTDYF